MTTKLSRVSAWVGLVLGVITLLGAASAATIRLLGVETIEAAEKSRGELRNEIREDFSALEQAQRKDNEALRRIELDLTATRNDVMWIREALKDAGFRARE